MEPRLKIAVFVDYDNIEIGVKSTLHRDFDVSLVLDALKERGDIIAKFAYANWERQVGATRQMAENAVQMVQRVPSPRGDKNGADINLALDTLEMAFTHPHINAFAVVSGDSDFISLVNKLKEYGKTIFVVGGKAFTSTILQKNCHEFISYESMLEEPQKAPPRQQQSRDRQPQQHPPQPRPEPLDPQQVVPLVERALQVLERREVQPQLGILKSTMLQLDATFTERDYGAGSFKEFIDKLKNAGFINVIENNRRYLIERKGSGAEKVKPVRKQEESLSLLRDFLETHRFELEEGATVDELATWIQSEHPTFHWKEFGFQEFQELLNYAQDKLLVRLEPQGEKVTAFLGAEFYPPADMELPTAPPPPPATKRSRKRPAAQHHPRLPMAGPENAPPRKRTARKRSDQEQHAAAADDQQRPARSPRKRPVKQASAAPAAEGAEG